MVITVHIESDAPFLRLIHRKADLCLFFFKWGSTLYVDHYSPVLNLLINKR